MLRACEPLCRMRAAFGCTEADTVIPSRMDSLAEAGMAGEGLFDDLPETPVAGRSKAAGEARMREPVRDQIELRAVDLDSLIGADHPARAFWVMSSNLTSGNWRTPSRRVNTRPDRRRRAPDGCWRFGSMR